MNNYNELINKPTINGKELIGDMVISGSGVKTYGAFMDTDRIITTLAGSGSGDTFQNYVAIEDCAVAGTIQGDTGAVQIDDVTVAYTSDPSLVIGVCVYVKKGQKVSYRMNSTSTLTVYGLTSGTNTSDWS